LTERGGVKRIKKLYDEAQSVVVNKLRKLGPAKETFTAHRHRIMLAELRQGQAVVAKRLAGELGDISRETQIDALRGLVGDLSRLEAEFTGADLVLPIDEAGRFWGVIENRRESLLRMHDVSMANYGGRLVTKMEDGLAMSLMTGEDFGTTVDKMAEIIDGEAWQGERIVRTEILSAYNSTQHDGLVEASEELPDLMMRWTELVSDSTEEGLDDRVAEDSLAMHGQVAPVGGSFKFPGDLPDGTPLSKSSAHLMGKAWSFPPNRPNDRSSLTPVRPHWGIPGWQLVGGQRVPWPG